MAIKNILLMKINKMDSNQDDSLFYLKRTL